MTYYTLHVLTFGFGLRALSLSLSWWMSRHNVFCSLFFTSPPVHCYSHLSLLLLSGEQLLQGGVFVIPDDVMQTDPFLFSILYSLLLYSHHTPHTTLCDATLTLSYLFPQTKKVIYMLLIRVVHNLAVFFQSR